MDLSRAVTFRTVNLNSLAAQTPAAPMDGYITEEVRLGPVDGVGYKEKSALDDGFDYGRVFLGLREIRMRGTIYAPTHALLHDRIRIVRALFSPTLCYQQDPANKGFLPLYFSVPTTDIAEFPSGYIDLRAMVRPSEMPGAFFARDTAFGKDGEGFSTVWECALECADPRFYFQTDTSITCTATSGSGTTNNRGDYASPLQMSLILSGNTSGPRTITLTGFGSVMTVTVPAGTTTRIVRIDGDKKVCTLTQDGAETIRMDLVSFAAGYTWPRVAPGPNIYDWTSTGGVKSTGSRFWYSEAYV